MKTIIQKHNEEMVEFIDDIDNYVDYHGEADKEDMEPFIRKEEIKQFLLKNNQKLAEKIREEVIEEYCFVVDEVGQYYLNGKGAKNDYLKGIGEGLLRFRDFMKGDITGDTPRRLLITKKKLLNSINK